MLFVTLQLFGSLLKMSRVDLARGNEDIVNSNSNTRLESAAGDIN